MNELKICKHSNSHGWCSVYKTYCVEGPCEEEELVEYTPVVRCRECTHRVKSADLTDTVLCKWLHNLIMPKNGYCNYGELDKKV